MTDGKPDTAPIPTGPAPEPRELTMAEQVDRYIRQILLPGWGATGQKKLIRAVVAITGKGPAAEAAIRYLAGSGVGSLVVERFSDVVKQVNPHVRVIVFPGDGPGVLIARTGDLVIKADDDRAAVGAALAGEVIKSILGLPFQRYVGLPDPGADLPAPVEPKRLGDGS
jgi:hypothetical protein